MPYITKIYQEEKHPMKTSQYNSSTFPELFISVNKNRMKHYVQNQKVVTYLKPGTEFELEFNNNTNSCWLAKISINGKSISDSGLVLSPNDHVYLERYLDSSKKFKCDTFSIDDVEETRAALQQNGEIVVQFFKETIPLPTTYVYPWPTYPWPVNPWPSDRRQRRGTPWWGPGDDVVYTTCDSNGIKSGTYNNMSMRSAQSKSEVNENFAEASLYRCATLDVGSTKPQSIETTRVEEGGHSNQNFSTVYKQWEQVAFSIKIIQILPLSRKDITAKEINSFRQYCGGCGVKVSSKDIYCYKCGEKL
jgi:hypothetical protein